MWHNAVIVAAAVVSGLIQFRQSQKDNWIIRFRRGAKHPKPPAPTSFISKSELSDYHRDGFLLKKGLLQGIELEKLIEAAEEIYATNNQKDVSLPTYYKKLTFDLWRRKDEFAQLAFEDLPSVAAELMDISQTSKAWWKKRQHNAQNETLRILKDGFFGFQQKNNSGCGFHVDDEFFWPASYETTGVNFWVALSPMRISEGGGIRVVNQSKIEPIFDECWKAILTKNEKGYANTCHMETVSPQCNEKMFEASVVYDMEPGDALIWDRWTFHRSDPFRQASDEGAGKVEGQGEEKADDYRLRYTIRYVPGTAKAAGWHHKSQAKGEKFDSPYYPKVWPSAVKSEIKALQNGLMD